MTKSTMSGDFHHKKNSCSFGQSEGQEAQEPTDSPSKGESNEQAKEMKISLSAPCIRCSKGCTEKDISIPMKELLQLEEQTAGITFSRTREDSFSVPLTNSSAACSQRIAKPENCVTLIEMAQDASPVMKWAAFIFSMLGDYMTGELREALARRESIKASKAFPKISLFWWDVGVVLTLLLEYISEALAPSLTINWPPRK